MALLPKVDTPTYKVMLPLTKKEVTIRPFLVKEEKILLMAMQGYNEGDDTSKLTDAILTIVKNCILTKNVNPDELPSLDVETIFFEMRKKSVGEDIELMVTREKDGKTYQNKVKVDLDKVKIVTPEGHNNKIMLNTNSGITMRYPSIKASLEILTNPKKDVDAFYNLVCNSIDTIFDGDTVTKVVDFLKQPNAKKEMIEWIESFTQDHMESIMKFFNTIPYYYLEVPYVCKETKDKDVLTIKGVSSFFI